MLVVRGRKTTDPPPPFHGVQGLAASNQEAVEGHRVGTRVEKPKSPLWQVDVEGEVHRGSAGLPWKHQGRCISVGRRPPEDVDADGAWDGGEEGGPGPPICNFLCYSLLGMRG